MLNFNSIMVGSEDPKNLADFYTKVFGKPADSEDTTEEATYYGWLVGSCYFSVGGHSKIKGSAKEPERLMFNFETTEVKEEFERIKGVGAKVIQEPYELQGMWIATLADPEGNYFQLMTPWEGNK